MNNTIQDFHSQHLKIVKLEDPPIVENLRIFGNVSVFIVTLHLSQIIRYLSGLNSLGDSTIFGSIEIPTGLKQSLE